MLSRLKNSSQHPGAIRSRLLLLVASLLISGCSTVPSHYVQVVPPPVRSFPPAQPGFVRLPVVVNFPPTNNTLQEVVNFFKGRIKQLAQGPVLKSKMSDLWEKMASPIYLDKDLWLLIRPQTMSLGKMKGDPKIGTKANGVLEMTASPELFFGPPPLTVHRPMPPFQPYLPGPPIFEATSNVHMDYDDANRFLNDPRTKIDGTVIVGTGQKLTITGIRLYGSGGQIVVEANLTYIPLIVNLNSKPAKLTLYLKGTPRFLPKKRVFDLPDLDYDIKSSDLMIQMADLFFKSQFKDQLRKSIKFPVGQKMDVLKLKVSKALNRPFGPYMHLRTKVTSLSVTDGYADNQGIEMRVTIKGSAMLDVNWK